MSLSTTKFAAAQPQVESVEHSPSSKETPQLAVRFNAKEGISFKLYADNRPRNMEIASLQKGLVLEAFDVELVEEGAGFGLPIAKYGDRTVFSSTAQLSVQKQTDSEAVFRKIYVLDSVSKKSLRGIKLNDRFYRLIRKTFETGYLNRKTLRFAFALAMLLRNPVGVQTSFERVEPKGKVTVTYRCSLDQIRIAVDLSALDKTNCREILILNEQGAKYFQRYSDTDGVTLSGSQISPWTKVTAERSALTCDEVRLSFTLEKSCNALMFRGREQVRNRFSWSGLTYSLKPERNNFEYSLCLARN